MGIKFETLNCMPSIICHKRDMLVSISDVNHGKSNWTETENCMAQARNGFFSKSSFGNQT